MIPETLRCAACDTPFAVGSTSCDLCGLRLQGQRSPLWSGLLWSVKGYRVWSLGFFAYALIKLALTGQPGAYFSLFLILFPFGMALGLSYRMGDATPRWIVAFLILVDLGVIIAPQHQFLPRLGMFLGVPRTENRILTWYVLVYALLQFVLAPPVFFTKSLRTSWRGGKPALAPWICYFGFVVWGIIVTILTIALTR
jgi:hypothetical protein